jgi:hypothetical protein
MRILVIGGHASTPVICVIHVHFLRIPSKTTASYLITYRIQAVQVKFMTALAWKCSMKVKCSKAINQTACGEAPVLPTCRNDL